MQKLMTKEIESRVPALYSQDGLHNPVVYAHFFSPYSNWDWWMTEYDPKTRDAYGYVQGFEGEFGYFSLAEMEEVNRSGPLPMIERDAGFRPALAHDVARLRDLDWVAPDSPDQFSRQSAALAWRGEDGRMRLFDAHVAEDEDAPGGWGIYYDEWLLAADGAHECDGGQYWRYWGPVECFEGVHEREPFVEAGESERDALLGDGDYAAALAAVSERLEAEESLAYSAMPSLYASLGADRGAREGLGADDAR